MPGPAPVSICSCFLPPPHSFVHCDCTCITMVTNEWLFNLPISGCSSLVLKTFSTVHHAHMHKHTVCHAGKTTGARDSYSKQNLYLSHQVGHGGHTWWWPQPKWYVQVNVVVLFHVCSQYASAASQHTWNRQRCLQPRGFLPRSG